MVKIKGWGFVRPQMTEYSIVGRVPTRLGDVTELRNAGHRIVRVGLKEDTKGNWWLVELRAVAEPAPPPGAWPSRTGWKSERAPRITKKQKKRAALMAKIHALKQKLRAVKC